MYLVTKYSYRKTRTRTDSLVRRRQRKRDRRFGAWNVRSLYRAVSLTAAAKWEYNEAVHQLFIDFKKAYDSIWREVSYNILIEFGIPMKLVRLIKMCLTEMYSRARVGKNLSDMLPTRNGLETRRCSIAIASQLCFRVRH